MKTKVMPQEGRVNFRLMVDLKAKAMEHAAEMGVSFSELIRQLLTAELSN